MASIAAAKGQHLSVTVFQPTIEAFLSESNKKKSLHPLRDAIQATMMRNYASEDLFHTFLLACSLFRKEHMPLLFQAIGDVGKLASLNLLPMTERTVGAGCETLRLLHREFFSVERRGAAPAPHGSGITGGSGPVSGPKAADDSPAVKHEASRAGPRPVAEAKQQQQHPPQQQQPLQTGSSAGVGPVKTQPEERSGATAPGCHEELLARLVQTGVALVSASALNGVSLSNPLSLIFTFYLSASRGSIAEAMCSASIMQASHNILRTLRSPVSLTDTRYGGGDRPGAASTPTESQSLAPSSSTVVQPADSSARMAPHAPAAAASLASQVHAVAYYKDLCAMSCGLSPKWIRLSPAAVPRGSITEATTTASAGPAGTGAAAAGPAVHHCSVEMTPRLRMLLLNILNADLTDNADVLPDAANPLFVQCLNEELVALVLSSGLESGDAAGRGAQVGDAGAHAEVVEVFSLMQKLGVTAIVKAHRVMRHTMSAILSHHRMLVCYAGTSGSPWKMAVVLTLWRKAIASHQLLRDLLVPPGLRRYSVDHGASQLGGPTPLSRAEDTEVEAAARHDRVNVGVASHVAIEAKTHALLSQETDPVELDRRGGDSFLGGVSGRTSEPPRHAEAAALAGRGGCVDPSPRKGNRSRSHTGYDGKAMPVEAGCEWVTTSPFASLIQAAAALLSDIIAAWPGVYINVDQLSGPQRPKWLQLGSARATPAKQPPLSPPPPLARRAPPEAPRPTVAERDADDGTAEKTLVVSDASPAAPRVGEDGPENPPTEGSDSGNSAALQLAQAAAAAPSRAPTHRASRNTAAAPGERRGRTYSVLAVEPHPATEFTLCVLDFVTIVTQGLSRMIETERPAWHSIANSVASAHRSSINAKGTEPAERHSTDQKRRQLRNYLSINSTWGPYRELVATLHPGILRCSALAIQHLRGDDIVHTIIKSATHMLQACCLLSLTEQRDGYLNVFVSGLYLPNDTMEKLERSRARSSSRLTAGSGPATPHTADGDAPLPANPAGDPQVSEAEATPVMSGRHDSGTANDASSDWEKGGESRPSKSPITKSTSGPFPFMSSIAQFLTSSQSSQASSPATGIPALSSDSNSKTERKEQSARPPKRALASITSALTGNAQKVPAVGTHQASATSERRRRIAVAHQALAALDQKLHLLSSIITIAGTMGSLLQDGWRTVSRCLVVTEALFERIHALIPLVPEAEAMYKSAVTLRESLVSLFFDSGACLEAEALEVFVRDYVSEALRWPRGVLSAPRVSTVSAIATAAASTPTASSTSSGPQIATTHGSVLELSSQCLAVLAVSAGLHGRDDDDDDGASMLCSRRVERVWPWISQFYMRLFASSSDVGTVSMINDIASIAAHFLSVELMFSRQTTEDGSFPSVLNAVAASDPQVTVHADSSYDGMARSYASQQISALGISNSHRMAPSSLAVGPYAGTRVSVLLTSQRMDVFSSGRRYTGPLLPFVLKADGDDEEEHAALGASTTIRAAPSSAAKGEPTGPGVETAHIKPQALPFLLLSTVFSATSQDVISSEIVREELKLVQTFGQQLHGSSWIGILRLLENVTRQHRMDDVQVAFRILESIQHSFITSIDSEGLMQLIRCGGSFMAQSTTSAEKISANLSAVQLLWSVADYLAGMDEDKHAKAAASFSHWNCLLLELYEGCIDKRQEVRHSACKTLFALVLTHGERLPLASWRCFLRRVLSPLLEIANDAITECFTRAREQARLTAVVNMESPTATMDAEHAARGRRPSSAGDAEPSDATETDDSTPLANTVGSESSVWANTARSSNTDEKGRQLAPAANVKDTRFTSSTTTIKSPTDPVGLAKKPVGFARPAISAAPSGERAITTSLMLQPRLLTEMLCIIMDSTSRIFSANYDTVISLAAATRASAIGSQAQQSPGQPKVSPEPLLASADAVEEDLANTFLLFVHVCSLTHRPLPGESGETAALSALRSLYSLLMSLVPQRVLAHDVVERVWLAFEQIVLGSSATASIEAAIVRAHKAELCGRSAHASSPRPTFTSAAATATSDATINQRHCTPEVVSVAMASLGGVLSLFLGAERNVWSSVDATITRVHLLPREERQSASLAQHGRQGLFGQLSNALGFTTAPPQLVAEPEAPPEPVDSKTAAASRTFRSSFSLADLVPKEQAASSVGLPTTLLIRYIFFLSEARVCDSTVSSYFFPGKVQQSLINTVPALLSLLWSSVDAESAVESDSDLRDGEDFNVNSVDPRSRRGSACSMESAVRGAGRPRLCGARVGSASLNRSSLRRVIESLVLLQYALMDFFPEPKSVLRLTAHRAGGMLAPIGQSSADATPSLGFFDVIPPGSHPNTLLVMIGLLREIISQCVSVCMREGLFCGDAEKAVDPRKHAPASGIHIDSAANEAAVMSMVLWQLLPWAIRAVGGLLMLEYPTWRHTASTRQDDAAWKAAGGWGSRSRGSTFQTTFFTSLNASFFDSCDALLHFVLVDILANCLVGKAPLSPPLEEGVGKAHHHLTTSGSASPVEVEILDTTAWSDALRAECVHAFCDVFGDLVQVAVHAADAELRETSVDVTGEHASDSSGASAADAALASTRHAYRRLEQLVQLVEEVAATLIADTSGQPDGTGATCTRSSGQTEAERSNSDMHGSRVADATQLLFVLIPSSSLAPLPLRGVARLSWEVLCRFSMLSAYSEGPAGAAAPQGTLRGVARGMLQARNISLLGRYIKTAGDRGSDSDTADLVKDMLQSLACTYPPQPPAESVPPDDETAAELRELLPYLAELIGHGDRDLQHLLSQAVVGVLAALGIRKKSMQS